MVAQEMSQEQADDQPAAEYDLCIAWTTEYDAGFVELLDAACRMRGLSLLQVTPVNAEHICDELVADRLDFRAFFDRASDEDRSFLPIVEWARTHDVFRINPFENARLTWDKAAMHTAVSACVPTPMSIFLPAYNSEPELPDLDLSVLGPSITIKPAHGGGGVGVVVVATTIEQITEARQGAPDDMYMLQTRVVPTQLDGRAAWFRIIYADNRIYPSWWDFDSRCYRPVTVAEEAHYGLRALRELTEALAEVCNLQLFSTEIAIDTDHQFVVIDYINDPIDLTLASRRPDGVPDNIVGFIADDLADLVAGQVKA